MSAKCPLDEYEPMGIAGIKKYIHIRRNDT